MTSGRNLMDQKEKKILKSTYGKTLPGRYLKMQIVNSCNQIQMFQQLITQSLPLRRADDWSSGLYSMSKKINLLIVFTVQINQSNSSSLVVIIMYKIPSNAIPFLLFCTRLIKNLNNTKLRWKHRKICYCKIFNWKSWNHFLMY